MVSVLGPLFRTHHRFGSSSHMQQNGFLTQDLKAPSRLAAQRKMRMMLFIGT
jgi:hypothetical protein